MLIIIESCKKVDIVRQCRCATEWPTLKLMTRCITSSQLRWVDIGINGCLLFAPLNRLWNDSNKKTLQLIVKYDNFWTNLTKVNSVCLCSGSDHIFCTRQKYKGFMKVLGIMSYLTHCVPCRIHWDKNGLYDPCCLLSSYNLQFWSSRLNVQRKRERSIMNLL